MVDTFAAYVWEPAVVKINALTAATEAACLILSVDETARPCSGIPRDGCDSHPEAESFLKVFMVMRVLAMRRQLLASALLP